MNSYTPSTISLFRRVVLGLFFSVLGAGLLQAPCINAISGSDWAAGNIIDDSVFTDSTSMSVEQIQNFLNNQIGTCDTNGSQPSELGGGTRAQYGAANGNPAPFTCLNGYYEVPKTTPSPNIPASNYGSTTIPNGAKSAAQIIWDASQQYQISPTVLLVKLATESAGPLTKDPWPFKKQYLYAMGAHCPDSGPGGSANCDINYAGFSIQIAEAAKLLRGYLNNMTQSWWSYKKPYQTNSILWNVVERGCGSANVYIQNKATAALYTYTPYQPNQAALNNLYGTGDNCSAYGNRNFWRVFNDYFGSLNKPLVRTEASGALYYIDGSVKHSVTSMQVASEFGLGTNDVRFASQAYLDSKPTASVPFNYLVKSVDDSDADGGNLYLVSGGKRHLITSMSQLSAFGLNTGSITYLPYSDVLLLPLAGNLSNFITKPNGLTFQVIDAKRSTIFQPALLKSLNPSGYTSKLSDFIISKIPPTTPSISNYLTLVDQSTGKIWVTNGEEWSYVPSMNVLSCYNVSSNIKFSQSDTIIGTQVDTASCTASTSTGEKYILNKDSRYAIDVSWNLPTNTVVNDAIVTSKPLTSSSSTSVFLTQTGALYIFKDGHKRHITSMNALSDNSLSSTVFNNINSESIAAIPNGSNVYQDGTVLKKKETGQLYVVVGDSLIYINSMAVFSAFGFKQSNIISLPDSTIDTYQLSQAPLKPVAAFGDKVYFANGSAKLLILPDQADYYYDEGTLSSYPSRLLSNLPTELTATRFVKPANAAQLYIMDDGLRRPVYSWGRYTQYGGTNNNLTLIDGNVLPVLPVGTPI